MHVFISNGNLKNRLEYAYGKILFRLKSDFAEFNFVNEPFWRVCGL